MNFLSFIKPLLGWNNVFSFLFLGGAFGAALFFRGTDSMLFAPALIGLLIAGLLMLRPFGRLAPWALPCSATAIFLFLFWAYMGISLFWSTIPYMSTLFFFILSALPFLFFALVMAPDSAFVTRGAFILFLLMMAATAVWAATQFFFLYDVFGPRIKHPMLNPNNMAAVLNMALFPALGLFFMARGRWVVIAAGALAALLLFALLVTQSRGAFLVAVLVLPLFLLFVKPAVTHFWIRTAAFAFVTGLWTLIVNIKSTGLLEKYVVTMPGMGHTHSVVDRLSLWDSTLQMMMAHPWTGTGLVSFSYYYGYYRDVKDVSDGYFAHMDPLQFGAEMGVMAPFLFYGFLLAVLWRTVRAVLAAGQDYALRAHIIVPFLAVGTLAMHTHISFHLYMPVVLIPAAILLAYWYVKTEEALPDARWSVAECGATMHKGLGVALVALCLLSGVWVARAVADVHYTAEVKSLMRERQKKQAKAALDRLCFWGPGNGFHCDEYHARFVIDRFINKKKNLSLSEREGLYKEAMIYLDRLEETHPAMTHIWDLRAKLYFAAQGDVIPDGYRKAEQELRRLLAADPLNVDARIGLAAIYKKRGEFKKALAVLEDGLRWPRPKAPVSVHYLMETANMQRQLGNLRGYQQLFNQAQNMARNLQRHQTKMQGHRR